MNAVVVEFIEYLTQTKNYSSHTATAYETDIRDFLKFYEDFSGTPPFPRDLSRADTLCFRSYLANRQRRGLSHKSTARALSSLRGFYKYLARTHGIKNDSIGLISSPKVPRKLSKAIDTIDVENMRGAIRDIGRVYGMPYSKSDRLSKLIPQDAKTLKDAVSVSTEIQDILNQDLCFLQSLFLLYL